jgi:hypothetical protein
MGSIATGHRPFFMPFAPRLRANLLVVDGDPTRDIGATERIWLVVLKASGSDGWTCSTPRKTRYSREQSGNWVIGRVIGATLRVVKKKLAKKTAKPRRKR